MPPPLVGITCGFRTNTSPLGVESPTVSLDARFFDLLRQAGARPVIVPPALAEDDRLADTLETLDALILSGGPDLPPQRYGAQPHPQTRLMHPRRVWTDFTAAAFADGRGLPVLGICGGMQEWNVLRAGTLHQHLPDRATSPVVAHRHADGQDFEYHEVRVEAGSLLHRIVGCLRLRVNSSHHQGVDRLGGGLLACAWSEDGLVEAFEDPARRFCLSVQWHPEDMPGDPLQRRIFEALVKAAARK